MNGFMAILLKEFSHIRRDRGTIFFALLVPALQLILFGYAIKTTVDDIPTCVLNLDGRQESRALIQAMANTGTFTITERVYDMDSLRRALSSGRAKVGLMIPPDYSERLLRQEQAFAQALIDGSDSQVATSALNTVNLLATALSIQRGQAFGEKLQLAIARGPAGESAMPIEIRGRLLYNPKLESSHFFVPGLIGIILQVVLMFQTAFSVVREREQGTLEQLFVTPVGRSGLMLGKLIPYCLIAFGELLIILTVMVGLFGVPIHGQLSLLFAFSALFIFTALGMGLLISSFAKTQVQAMQLAYIVMLPSVLLSGFMFPRAEMPWPIYLISTLLPVTYFLEIVRGVILRSADFVDLAPYVFALALCCATVLSLSVICFRKQIE